MDRAAEAKDKEHRDYAFEVAFGGYILAKQHDGTTTIGLKALDTDLARFFFNSGWSWGKEEECPHCNLRPDLRSL